MPQEQQPRLNRTESDEDEDDDENDPQDPSNLTGIIFEYAVYLFVSDLVRHRYNIYKFQKTTTGTF